MFLLAINTSGKQGSIALARAGELDDYHGDFEVLEIVPLVGGTFSAQLIPQIAMLLNGQGLTKYNIDALTVASGPGSFTGLRVGLAAVKALAEILHKPIAAVSLLELCVFISGAQGKVMAVLDAGRGDVYAGEYNVPAKAGENAREQLLTMNEFLTQAKGWTVVTPDANLSTQAAASGLSVSTFAAITAADVARLGWRKLQSGETVTPDQLEANYIRRTDAEMLERIGS
jgi:tRNA threonylcarbamoyladenosine biosynthesis protein TsaB